MYLLDTDTIVYLLKGHPEVERNPALHADDVVGTSAITLMELYYGAFKSRQVAGNWGAAGSRCRSPAGRRRQCLPERVSCRGSCLGALAGEPRYRRRSRAYLRGQTRPPRSSSAGDLGHQPLHSRHHARLTATGVARGLTAHRGASATAAIPVDLRDLHRRKGGLSWPWGERKSAHGRGAGGNRGPRRNRPISHP